MPVATIELVVAKVSIERRFARMRVTRRAAISAAISAELVAAVACTQQQAVLQVAELAWAGTPFLRQVRQRASGADCFRSS